jgi:hypothetical protein
MIAISLVSLVVVFVIAIVIVADGYRRAHRK